MKNIFGKKLQCLVFKCKIKNEKTQLIVDIDSGTQKTWFKYCIVTTLHDEMSEP